MRLGGIVIAKQQGMEVLVPIYPRLCWLWTDSLYVLMSCFEMSTGNSPSGVTAPSPSPRGKNFPVPVPVKAHGEHFFPIPIPARGFNPCGDPHPSIKPSTAHRKDLVVQ